VREGHTHVAWAPIGNKQGAGRKDVSHVILFLITIHIILCNKSRFVIAPFASFCARKVLTKHTAKPANSTYPWD
jgi:hypothetical protein